VFVRVRVRDVQDRLLQFRRRDDLRVALRRDINGCIYVHFLRLRLCLERRGLHVYLCRLFLRLGRVCEKWQWHKYRMRQVRPGLLQDQQLGLPRVLTLHSW